MPKRTLPRTVQMHRKARRAVVANKRLHTKVKPSAKVYSRKNKERDMERKPTCGS